VAQLLATHGFLVVSANPRGSSTYGRRFAGLVLSDWGGQDYLDLLAVVEAIGRRPEADPARVGLYGFSYGGYMTAWMISQTSRFRAAVCGAPVFDLESFYGTSDIGYIFGAEEFGGPPAARRDWYAAHSPSTFAQRTRTPTLILHGEADERCPIGQGEQMFVALRQAGCEVEFVRYPGASHSLVAAGHPTQRVDLLARTLAWFQRHLAEPSG
jgi:dipeptidyl aminopeptidase/acylaminoacyl peptidase